MTSLTMSSLSYHWKHILKSLQRYHWMNEKAPPNRPYIPTQIEHVANVITHGIWVPASIYACFELVGRAISWSQYWSAVIYGLALILLFTISTCFHSVFFCHGHGHLKDILHRGDRAMIYVFIAASYFPWLTLRPLPPGGWAAELWWMIWLLASLGILYQQAFHEQFKWLETTFYLIMGVTPAFAIIYSDFPGMTELKTGGLFYIFGVLFFKMDGRIPCAHALWHIFVVLGAGVHYFAILHNLFPETT